MSDSTPQPPSLEDALTAPAADGIRQVVMIEPVWDAFVQSIYARGLHIFPIPVESSFPTYGVTPGSLHE